MENRFYKTLHSQFSRLIGPEISEKLSQKLNQVINVSISPKIKEEVAHLLQDFQELKDFARHPRAFGYLLEERSPWLGKRFLGAASGWLDPFTVGMGFRVQTLSEDWTEVILPGGWRNQGEGGVVHTAALMALGEYAVRLHWEHHLDFRQASVEARRVQVRVLSRPIGEMRAVFRLPVGDREAILHRLRTLNHIETETNTSVYDLDGRLVAEIEIEWLFARRLSLGAGAVRN